MIFLYIFYFEGSEQSSNDGVWDTYTTRNVNVTSKISKYKNSC